MKKTIKFILLTLGTLLFLVGCNNIDSVNKDDDGKLKVVTTIFPSYDFMREIGGDNVDVKMLISPGTETHSYEPSPQDIISIQNSDLFIYVGGESDRWIEKILKDIDKDEKSIISLMEISNLLEEELVEGMEEEEHDHDHGEIDEYDEHVWTSPKNSIKIVEGLMERISLIDGENSKEYESRGNEYIKKLVELDNDFRVLVENGKDRPLIFADRFPFLYFTKEYGLDYYGAFPGCSEDVEASPTTIKFLIDKVREESIPVVFYIEFSNEKLADIVVESTGAKKLLFNSAHNLTKDQFKQGVSYIDIMNDNLDSLKEALK